MRKDLELKDIISIFATHFVSKYILYGYQGSYQQKGFYDAAGGRRARHLAAGRESGRQRQPLAFPTQGDCASHRRDRLGTGGRRTRAAQSFDEVSPLRTRPDRRVEIELTQTRSDASR